MSDIISSWIKDNIDNEREFYRQALIVDVAEEISKQMDDRNINRSMLAKLLHKTSAYVTQLLTGSRNMTLTTLADLAFALDSKVKVSVVSKDADDDWNYEDVQLCSFLPRAQGSMEAERVIPCNDDFYATTTATIVHYRMREAA